MKKVLQIVLLGTTAAALAATSAAPVMAKGKFGARFEQMDANADGYIDQAEIIAARDARFDAMDANKDGAVDADEMEAYRKARMEEHADKRKKHANMRHAIMMKRLDANNDGKLQKEEMGNRMGERMMAHLDTDGDGRISKEEAEKMRGHRRKAAD